MDTWVGEIDDERWRVEDLTIDVGERRVYPDGRSVDLPKLSFQLLPALVGAAPRLPNTDAVTRGAQHGVPLSALGGDWTSEG